MKVLHLISGGDEGGAKTHVLTLLDRLIKEGINIELLCIMEGSFTEDARKLGIPLKVISQEKRYDFKTILKIKKYIAEGKYDIVHCHGARANFIAFFIKSGLNITFITTMHSDYKLDFKDSFYKQAIFMPINAIALRKFDYILPVTKSFEKMLLKRGFKKEKMFVIYNGINFDKKINLIPRKDFLKKYDISLKEGYTYVGIAARLQMVKGINHFLEGCKILLEQNEKIIFLIAGTGALEKQIRHFINQNKLEKSIKLLGFIKDIDNFYTAIDINILTSYSESFPYSLLEGARMKKATIATNVGGIPEMIKDFETGILIKPYNANEIAEKIKFFAKDKSIMNEFGENFYKDVFENFSDIKMAKIHIEIYERILKEK
ncbi:MAG: glycosyltransferase family 4 protein [Eubacteriales bacterium]|nr:glycosyltransferase family 4 protein [Eubacteriales bacterium]